MKLSTTFVCLILVLGVLPLRAAAQAAAGNGTSDGISVYGLGELGVEPNCVEIDLSISGLAELPGDALVKYRDAKSQLLESLDKLKLDKLETEEVGLSISAATSPEEQQRILQGMPQAQAKPQIEVSSVMRLKLNDIRGVRPEELLQTIGRLLDVAQDAGVGVGLSPTEMVNAIRRGQYGNQQLPIRFVVADLAQLREKAYEKAVEDARDRAARLARLNRVKLGATLAVHEVLVAGDQPTVQHVTNFGQQAPPPHVAEGPRVVSSSLTDIPVQVKLLVRFAIEPLDPATARK